MIEKEIINFKTKGKWTLKDMMDLLTSVNQVYNAVYAINIKQLEIDRAIKSLVESLDDYYPYWRKHIIYLSDEFWHIWRKILEDYLSRKRPYPPFLLPCFYPFIPLDVSKIMEIDAVQIYKNIDIYIYPEQRLSIRKIVMESPGTISLEGCGEIIRQIRELIKDLWYRNRLEKLEKEIELNIRKIEYAEKLEKILRKYRKYNYGQSIKPENELIGIIINGVNKLEQLEKDKKLENVPENIESNS